MAWTRVRWACGHYGEVDIRGPYSQRAHRVAVEAGRKCMACWLLSEWEKSGDPRWFRDDRESLAASIAEGKGIRIWGPWKEEKEDHDRILELWKEVAHDQQRHD